MYFRHLQSAWRGAARYEATTANVQRARRRFWVLAFRGTSSVWGRWFCSAYWESQALLNASGQPPNRATSHLFEWFAHFWTLIAVLEVMAL